MAGWLDTIQRVWDSYLTPAVSVFANTKDNVCAYQGRGADKQNDTNVLTDIGAGSSGRVYDCKNKVSIMNMGFTKVSWLRMDCAGFISTCLMEAGWAKSQVGVDNFNNDGGGNFTGKDNFKHVIFNSPVDIRTTTSITLKDGTTYTPKAGDIMVECGTVGGKKHHHVNIYYSQSLWYDMGNSIKFSLKGSKGRNGWKDGAAWTSAWVWNGNGGGSEGGSMGVYDDTKPAYIYGVDDAWIADDTQETYLEAIEAWENDEYDEDTPKEYWTNALLAYNECEDIIDSEENNSASAISSEESSEEDSENLMDGTDAASNAANVSVEGQEEETKAFRRIIMNKNSNVNETEDMVVDVADGDQGSTTSSTDKTIGVNGPLIKIKGHVYTHQFVDFMQISSVGKIPTIKLQMHFDAEDKNTFIIKQGDKISVFYHAGNNNITSYKADYAINTIRQFKDGVSGMVYEMSGELYIPNLYDGTLPLSIFGSSKTVMSHMAGVLGLHWQYSDPEDTNDQLIWYCTPPATKKKRKTMYLDFLDRVAKHAYKNKDSYFDWWIDPRQALTFSNMNYILGEEGPDEEVQMAILVSNMTLDININKLLPSASKAKEETLILAHLLHNIQGEVTQASTPFFIISDLTKDALSFAYDGTSILNVYEINNNGLSDDKNNISFEAVICKNEYKLKHGWRLDLGGATNGNTADNGSYSELHKAKHLTGILTTYSDGDAKNIKKSGTNNQASGSTHKYYTVAESHNELNLNYLYHKVIKFRLAGNNMQLVKGDLVPVMYLDVTQRTSITAGNTPTALALMDQLKCGWFMIKSVTKTYSAEWSDNYNNEPGWRTEVELVRRDWPIPNYMETEEESSEEAIIVKNDLSNVVEEQWADSENVIASDGANDNLNDVTASGLTQRTENLYNELREIATYYGNGIKLVSGRRWAADADGNKFDGEGFYQNEAGQYKFVNAEGVVMWFYDKDSPHVKGEAIDIINESGTEFKRVMSLMLADDEFLYQMLTGGYFCMVESSQDSTGGTSKHYHIGTARSNNSGDVNAQAKWWLNVILFKGETLSYNGKSYDYSLYLKYANAGDWVNTSTVDSSIADTSTAVTTENTTTYLIDSNPTNIENKLKEVNALIQKKNLTEYIKATALSNKLHIYLTCTDKYKETDKLPSDYKDSDGDLSAGYTLSSCLHYIELEFDEDSEYTWKKNNTWDITMTNAYTAAYQTLIDHSATEYLTVQYPENSIPSIELTTSNDTNTSHLTMKETCTAEYYKSKAYTEALDLYNKWKSTFNK